VEKVDVPRRDSIEAFLGSRAHETLEVLYKNKMMGKMWAKEEYLQSFANAWEKKKTGKLNIVNRQYSEEDYYRQGYDALSKYWDRYYPFDQEKTIALECHVSLYLDDSKRYKLQGYVDRISKTPEGIWQIRDYKTKRKLPTLQEAQIDRQLALYQIGLQSMWDKTEKVELIWHYLLFDEEIKSTRGRTELERLKIDTIHVIQEVEQAVEKNDFPYNESALCDWCDYFDICPAKKHLAQVRKLTPKEFKENDGVALADGYSTLLSRKAANQIELKRVEEEMAALEQDIYAFAEQLEVSKIYGSSRYLSVSVKETFATPPSNTTEGKELRQQLEQLLKANKVWDIVSQLNSQRLVNLFENNELPQHLRDQIQRFLTAEVKRRIYSGKLKECDENFEQ
jgi:CRISPR/Cas system-associated exonuclease Cas4 (RecB family)